MDRYSRETSPQSVFEWRDSCTMQQDLAGPMNRRGFLGTGAGALAVASAVGIGRESVAQTAGARRSCRPVLPKRIWVERVSR